MQEEQGGVHAYDVQVPAGHGGHDEDLQRRGDERPQEQGRPDGAVALQNGPRAPSDRVTQETVDGGADDLAEPGDRHRHAQDDDRQAGAVDLAGSHLLRDDGEAQTQEDRRGHPQEHRRPPVPAGSGGDAAAFERPGGRRRDEPQTEEDGDDQDADRPRRRPGEPGQHHRHHADGAQSRSGVGGPQTRETVLMKMSRFVSELGHGSSGTKDASARRAIRAGHSEPWVRSATAA